MALHLAGAFASLWGCKQKLSNRQRAGGVCSRLLGPSDCPGLYPTGESHVGLSRTAPRSEELSGASRARVPSSSSFQ